MVETENEKTFSEFPFQLSPKEQRIYSGLKIIGEEISNFYLDALKIVHGHTSLSSRSYILFHLLREIDGGFRNIFGEDKNQTTGKGDSEKKGHLISIMSVLGIQEKNELADKWLMVAGLFADYAHRHGAYKESRPLENLLQVWEDYQDVLAKIVGAYPLLFDKIDRIIESGKINEYRKGFILSVLRREHPWKKRIYEKMLSRKSNLLEWINILEETGLFRPEEKPTKVTSEGGNRWYYPPWIEMEFLYKALELYNLSQNDDSSKSKERISKIISVLVLDRETEEIEKKNPHVDWQIFKIIALLPEDLLSLDHIKFIGLALKDEGNSPLIAGDLAQAFLKKLIEADNKEFVVEIIKESLSCRPDDNGRTIKSCVDEYWLHQIIEANLKYLEVFCPNEMAEVVFGKIKELVEADKRRFSIFDVPSIEEKENEFGGRFDYHKTIIRFFSDMVNAFDDAKKEKWIRALLADGLEPYSIFRRIAIHVIDKNYINKNDERFRKLFWLLPFNPLKNRLLKHEVYDLVKRHALKMTEVEVEKYIEWVQEDPWIRPDIKEDEKPQYIAYYKREWLSALSEIKEGSHRELEEKLKKDYDKEIRHPGRIIWTESGDKEREPLYNAELVQHLKDIVERREISALKDLLSKDEGTDWERERFGYSLGKAMSEEIDAFTALLPELAGVGYHHLATMAMVYQGKQEDQKSFDVPLVLEWMTNVMERIRREARTEETHTLAYRIAEFLNKGINPDEKPLPSEHLEDTHKAILALIALPLYDRNISYDGISIWNHVESIRWQAVMEFVRRWTQEYKKPEGERWNGIEDIREALSDRLEKRIEVSPHFYYMFSMYLPIIKYVDNDFFDEHLKHLFPSDDSTRLKASFLGHLSARKIYVDVYERLLSVYELAASSAKVDFADVDSFFIARLAHHLFEMYFSNTIQNKEDDGRIFKFIAHSSFQITEEIVLHVLRNKMQIEKVIVKLWDAIDERMDRDQLFRKKVLPNVFALLPRLHNNENVQRIALKEAEYFSDGEVYTGRIFHDIPATAYEEQPRFFLDLLDKIIKRIGIQAYLLKDYAPKILTAAYESKNDDVKSRADEVVDKLMSIGFFEAKDIYQRYNKES